MVPQTVLSYRYVVEIGLKLNVTQTNINTYSRKCPCVFSLSSFSCFQTDLNNLTSLSMPHFSSDDRSIARSLRLMQTHTYKHTYTGKKDCVLSLLIEAARRQRCSSERLLRFSLLVRSFTIRRCGGEAGVRVQVGNQPEASTCKCRPWSARFMFASPATFASNNIHLLLIIFYCKHKSGWLQFKSGWQGGQRTRGTKTKTSKSPHKEEHMCGSETELE